MSRHLALTLALSALLATALAGSASAYTSSKPTSSGNPLAGVPWFVDWEEGLSQKQVLSYVARGDKGLSEILFGPAVVPPPEPEPEPEPEDPCLNWQSVTAPCPYENYGPLYRTDGPNPYAALQTFDPAKLIAGVRPADRANAQAIVKIARNPQTRRVTSASAAPGPAIAEYFRRAQETAPGSLSFIYAYGFRHVYGDAQRRLESTCGNFDEGRAGDARYRRWITSLAEGIGSNRAAVFLEPDGVMTMPCLSRRAKNARFGLYNFAIAKLNALPNTAVYIDAGHSGWYAKKVIRTKAAILKKAGVLKARGFFLNSTGYHRTSREVAHGNKLVNLLGGKPRFVVSTAVNGNGPYVVRGRKLRYPAEQRCNPPGRALGDEPTVRTSSKFADAYVWIGDPGRAGGKCPHKGQPPSPGGGQWWEWYAAELARNARWK